MKKRAGKRSGIWRGTVDVSSFAERGNRETAFFLSQLSARKLQLAVLNMSASVNITLGNLDLFTHDLHNNLSVPCAIELTEKYCLPGAEK